MMNEEKEIMRSQYRNSFFEEFKQLVLTNECLIIGDRSIMLTDILEAYAETKGVFASITKLAIGLKDGEVIVCPIKKEGGSFSGFLNPELQFKADVERWVTLINRVLASTPIS